MMNVHKISTDKIKRMSDEAKPKENKQNPSQIASRKTKIDFQMYRRVQNSMYINTKPFKP